MIEEVDVEASHTTSRDLFGEESEVRAPKLQHQAAQGFKKITTSLNNDKSIATRDLRL
jgi:hypothetical protein